MIFDVKDKSKHTGINDKCYLYCLINLDMLNSSEDLHLFSNNNFASKGE